VNAPEFDPANPHAVSAVRVLAEAAARAGGKEARRFFRTEFDIRLKEDRSEVSEADETAQVAVIERIHQERPHDTFLGEEDIELPGGAAAPSDEGVCWVIDPIDGTRNFVRHIPLFSCSVAALHAGTPLVGAIYDPMRDVMYSASRGTRGLFINGDLVPPAPLERSAGRGLSTKPIVAIPSSPSGATNRLSHDCLERYVCRVLGSTALHLALVAAGEFDATVADNPRLWDIAAGWVLVEAADREITRADNKPVFPLEIARYRGERMPIIAGSPALVREMLRISAD
jgi:myo-inositol-1(or 4)-monophosphatase